LKIVPEAMTRDMDAAALDAGDTVAT